MKRIVDDTERIACGSKATELQVNPITHKMKNPTQRKPWNQHRYGWHSQF